MSRRFAPLVALVLLTLPALATAGHGETETVGDCDARGQPSLGVLEVTDGTPDGTYYIEDRNAVSGNGLWMWEESNGVWTPKGPGHYAGEVVSHDLQRGGFDGIGDCEDIGDWAPDMGRLLL